MDGGSLKAMWALSLIAAGVAGVALGIYPSIGSLSPYIFVVLIVVIVVSVLVATMSSVVLTVAWRARYRASLVVLLLDLAVVFAFSNWFFGWQRPIFTVVALVGLMIGPAISVVIAVRAKDDRLAADEAE